MIETRYPNRWFGANPQALSSQGKQLSDFPRQVARDWRSALGLAAEDGPTEAQSSPEATAAE